MMEGGRERKIEEERPENQEFLKKRVGIEYIDLSTPPETLEKKSQKNIVKRNKETSRS